MKSKQNDIGALIGKKVALAEQQDRGFDAAMEWNAIKPAVRKFNFFRWNARTWNVYYFLTSAVFVTLNLYVFLFPSKSNTQISSTHRTGADSLRNSRPAEILSGASVPATAGREEKKTSAAAPAASSARSPQVSGIPVMPSDTGSANTATIHESPGSGSSGEKSAADPETEEKPRETILPSVPTLKKLNYLDTIIKTDTVRKVKTKRIYR